jgi:hypothetical protein
MGHPEQRGRPVISFGVSPATKRFCLTAIVFAVALILISCSGPGISAYKLATVSSSSGLGLNAKLEGPLAGKTNDDGTACLWITDSGVTTVLIWPQGFSAQGTPLEIHDGKGQRVAQVGHRVALRGGLGQPPPSGSVLGCGEVRRVWIVAEVVPLN